MSDKEKATLEDAAVKIDDVVENLTRKAADAAS
jgi:hypothetical protein